MKRLAIFLAVTFGLSWGIWIPAGIALKTFETGVNSSMAMVILVAIAMFFPLVGALVANFACKPEERINLCFRPLIRGNVRSYLLAWLAPSVLSVLGAALFFLVNPQLFDPTMSSAAASLGAEASASLPTDQMPLILAATIVSAIVVAPFINMIPAFGEEAGWRGMLFPTLCERMSQRNAALLSGIIWGIWHAPIIAMGHNYGMNYLGFPWTGILVMTIACIAIGICLSYLRVRTQSVWPCALAHGSINAFANIGVAFCAAGQTLAGPSPLGYLGIIPIAVLAVFCWRKL